MNVRHVASDDDPTRASRVLQRAMGVVATRPSLWVLAVAAAVRFAPTGWWHRPPFLPVPDERYWRFRMETAYGDEHAVVRAPDLDATIHWSHRARARRQ